jgi:pimeloyl-ACP methyl ester carboxylesterase
VTIVLVHGAGHTPRVWDAFAAALGHPTVAVELPGRGCHPADLTAITLDGAAAGAAADVRAATEGPWTVVAHSCAGIMAPRLVAELGDVDHLVLLAAMCAPDGGRAIDVVDPDRRLGLEEQREPALARWRGHSYVADDAEAAALPATLQPLRDRRVLQLVDSVVAMYQTVSWAGVPDGLRRTWIRPRRDEIQPPDVQERLIAACGATTVPTIDTGHAAHREDPEGLAVIVRGLLA